MKAADLKRWLATIPDDAEIQVYTLQPDQDAYYERGEDDYKEIWSPLGFHCLKAVKIEREEWPYKKPEGKE